MKDVCVKVAEEVMKETGVEFKYHIGTMIEIRHGSGRCHRQGR